MKNSMIHHFNEHAKCCKQKDPLFSEAQNEFERMLANFIQEPYGEEHPEDPKEDEENTEVENDQENEEEDEEEEIYEEDADVDDVVLPDDIIEQNNNITVRVDIIPPMKKPRQALNNLIGCQNIKKRIEELVALTNYNRMKSTLDPNSKLHNISLHSIFYGRPGTGKTTVCKIYGSLMKEAGVLSKGHVVICNRGTFIGTLWGDEERAVRQVIDKAQGGVLMIDEAYLLNTKNPNDPGKMILPLLMEILADESQRDIAIILCGYKEPMIEMLRINEGLQSRFPNIFEFQDFTIDELLRITRLRVAEYNYHFTRTAWAKYKQMIENAYASRDADTWGNARFIANQLDRIYLTHAQRCVHQQSINSKQIQMLTHADIQAIDVPKPTKRIGFAV